jgi:hypothetical protein
MDVSTEFTNEAIQTPHGFGAALNFSSSVGSGNFMLDPGFYLHLPAWM